MLITSAKTRGASSFSSAIGVFSRSAVTMFAGNTFNLGDRGMGRHAVEAAVQAVVGLQGDLAFLFASPKSSLTPFLFSRSLMAMFSHSFSGVGSV